MAECLHCGSPLQRKEIGRFPVYCSSACKQAEYRKKVTLRNAGDAQNDTSQAFDVYKTMEEIGIDIKDFEQRPKDYQVYFVAELLSRTIPFDVLMHAFIVSLKREDEKKLQAYEDSWAAFNSISP